MYYVSETGFLTIICAWVIAIIMIVGIDKQKQCRKNLFGEYSNGMLISAVNEYDGEEMLNLLLVDDRIPAGAKLY
jgi:hypothetical protein